MTDKIEVVECAFCKPGYACVLASEHWPNSEGLRKCGPKPCMYETGDFFRMVPVSAPEDAES